MNLKNTLIRIATPAVYSGAAFLILLVGIRTLLLTTDEGFGTIGKFTLGAILFEFFSTSALCVDDIYPNR